ncbi:SPOR domain-containing protein [uncultured Brevundimonas sp.]|uniref:SPOR domain-containing protein n=1 Tax=uncultured Brevundimonas sp. TaxID=213418 RepID=UPI0030EDDC87|tara:strand:+ start:8258 stop:8893 length:636 start_codon:yes stop_codon:yes gene_type:complete
MIPAPLFRSVLAAVLVSGLSACGAVESDPHRFENLANRIAAIPLDGSRAPKAVPSARELGLRPAQPASLRVEIMDPHELWDARDGGLDGLVDRAAPVVARAVVQQVSTRVAASAAEAGLRPALKPAPVARPVPTGLIQLGAYSSEDSARLAWARLTAKADSGVLTGLAPVFEGVDVDGRRLVRLKVAAPAGAAAAVCAAARIDDPWCRRNT